MRVDIGTWASFNCSLPCNYNESHTINWFLGDSPIVRRNVYLTRTGFIEREFEQYTGIEIELTDTSDCNTAPSGEGVSRQQLRILVSETTLQRVNKTAVQCAALRKDDRDVDLYSLFSVMLVNGTYTVCA